ncbi:hypothetical protein EYF80_028251 [Liparis tanakae]|uniref:Uncharacterized protein n=1 Tax=Liparis tanakae TaxID=230148 RepID=A0A4Z2H6X5_9TELE|nr:hypothetical protein EYF80_028251 [Liparis tanakae]
MALEARPEASPHISHPSPPGNYYQKGTPGYVNQNLLAQRLDPSTSWQGAVAPVLFWRLTSVNKCQVSRYNGGIVLSDICITYGDDAEHQTPSGLDFFK